MRTPRTLAAVVALAGSAASAHPVHEVVQNAYLTLAPGSVELSLELTAGPEVAGRILRALDANHDRRVDRAEARAYAARVLVQSRLAIDGEFLALALRSVEVPPYAALLGAHGTIRIAATASRPDRPGPALLAYRNGYSPAESRCDANIFAKAGDRLRYRVITQRRSADGRALAVHFAATSA